MKDNQNQIEVSLAALMQIKLILANDFTLKGKCFRLTIGGKGCDGFTYQTGFTDANEKDHVLIYTLPNDKELIEIHLDPFTFHYFKQGKIDYLLNTETNEEGFVVENYDQNKYHGKFFKDKSTLPDFDSGPAQ